MQFLETSIDFRPEVGIGHDVMDGAFIRKGLDHLYYLLRHDKKGVCRQGFFLTEIHDLSFGDLSIRPSMAEPFAFWNAGR
jgi:hypothetical protein